MSNTINRNSRTILNELIQKLKLNRGTRYKTDYQPDLVRGGFICTCIFTDKDGNEYKGEGHGVKKVEAEEMACTELLKSLPLEFKRVVNIPACNSVEPSTSSRSTNIPASNTVEPNTSSRSTNIRASNTVEPSSNSSNIPADTAVEVTNSTQQSLVQQGITAHSSNSVKVTPGVKQVGSKIFIYVPERNLGEGSSGAVCEGYFENDHTGKAAVKWIRNTRNGIDIQREIENLRKLADENVVRYFASEYTSVGVYIAMALAEGSLEDFCGIYIIEHKMFKKILFDAICGLCAIHSLERPIVHRDIKPANILLFRDTETMDIIGKLGDFGLSREMSTDHGTETQVKGTINWLPPEAHVAMHKDEHEQKKFKLKTSSDIFCMGITIFYTLTNKSNPFGAKKLDIMKAHENGKGTPDFSLINDIENCGLRNLLEKMLSNDPDSRPTAQSVRNHPFFWSSSTNIQFLTVVANELKLKSSSNIKTVELLQPEYIKFCNKFKDRCSSWKNCLCENVQKFLSDRDLEEEETKKKKKKYNENSFVLLLEFIRDQKQHPDEWKSLEYLTTENVFGKDGCNYDNYFTEKFPQLTTLVFTLLQDPERRSGEINKFYLENSQEIFNNLMHKHT